MASLRVALALLGLACLINAVPVEQVVSKRRHMIAGRPHFGLVPKPQVGEFVMQDSVVSGTIDNYIDHLNKSMGTFKQRYWSNSQWYKPGGPVFFMLGGESAENGYWVSDGDLEWTQMAKTHGAQVYLVEHRYYGESRPTPDMSTSNLLYLSSAQALEDFAYFITLMKTQNPNFQNVSWVTFGGSYSGNLAAWMRIKHPEHVTHAVGSSGPVLAELDFVEYMEVVRSSISQTSQSCADSITAGMSQVAQLLQTAAGRTTLKSTFNLCQSLNINDANQIQNFWSSLFGPYMETVQYSGDNAGVFKNSVTINRAICKFHNNNSSSLLDRLKQVNSYYDAVFGYYGCSDIDYNGMITWMQNTAFGAESSDTRAWVYQTCTEFGYYQSTDSVTAGPFWGGRGNVNITFYTQQCAQVYGPQFTNSNIQSGVSGTNWFYGGRTMNSSYIILPNGDFDPWHALGKLNTDLGSTIVPVVIHGTAHCADMYPASSTDLSSLTNARKKIADTLAGWLNN
ncbi:unnamed protein product [Auanema sp. JU1783]|nr:unnamed protein product [Auanema sp. JU1783]